MLKEANELSHRGRDYAKTKRVVSTHKATGPNQGWMWDITYLNGPIKGKYYYLYLFSDLFSRKIVGWAVYDCESADLAGN